ncbi:MAG: tRNA1(Val) (adenine(37)-N6)-methyltransferase [Candidatus Izemoplasmatales bacterium]|uniref:tRNA1(Val) (Adenine(37)-N6)-methyltransferase n=1 Tax=Hujiaoplasma nucleasis TaxID=2725268 RepID=A0A7L6N6Z5_9MOLU|nr:tRNA1(Val) (adenine(37)-N6)-methyltransferase [Hujiaoplasma nucleasis]QLY40329.1 tRNA1(Val) (adenine(37)-N6)-methyltransferase [Hujiaoplasma nucleasis]
MSNLHIHDLLAYDGLKIIQKDDLFKFSLDSLLLGDFVNINPRVKNIIDLGCGLGPVSFYMSLKTKAKIIGVDIQEEVIHLARESAKLNHLETQVSFLHEDIKDVYKHFETNQFDIVVCNPPFYKSKDSKQHNDLASLSIARHEVMLNLSDLFDAGKRLLKQGGILYFIHRVERMDEIIIEMNKHHFVAKRIRFVYTLAHKEAKMLLVEARYNGSMGSLIIEQPLYIHDENNQYTDEVLRIFHLGDENYEKTSSL